MHTMNLICSNNPILRRYCIEALIKIDQNFSSYDDGVIQSDVGKNNVEVEVLFLLNKISVNVLV